MLRDRHGIRTMQQAAGAGRRDPAFGVPFGLFLLGLIGLPPMLGFAAKFGLFAQFYASGSALAVDYPPLRIWVAAVLGAAVLATVVGAAAYLRVAQKLFVEAGTESDITLPPAIRDPKFWLCWLLAIASLVLGVWVAPLDRLAVLAGGGS